MGGDFHLHFFCDEKYRTSTRYKVERKRSALSNLRRLSALSSPLACPALLEPALFLFCFYSVEIPYRIVPSHEYFILQ